MDKKLKKIDIAKEQVKKKSEKLKKVKLELEEAQLKVEEDEKTALYKQYKKTGLSFNEFYNIIHDLFEKEIKQEKI